VIVLGILLIGLCSKSFRTWFNADPEQRFHSADWTLPLLIVGAPIATAAAMQNREYDRKLKESIEVAFAIDTQFEFRNSDTGGGVEWVSYDLPFRDRKRDPLGPRLQVESASGPNGPTVRFVGNSGRPADITFYCRRLLA
jgi:hypothetical protein